MKLTVVNTNDDITYYNKDTISIYNKKEIIRLKNNENYNNPEEIIAKLIGISKDLGNQDIKALEVLLITDNIKAKDFRDFFCNKYKVSISTAVRCLTSLTMKHIITIDKNDIIHLTDNYKIKDKNVNETKVIIIEMTNN